MRLLRHEWTLACLGSLVLALAMTWLLPPVATWVLTSGEVWTGVADLRTTLTGDLGDPTLQAWQVAWAAHALTTDPSRLWDANVFYPEAGTLAYSDSLLGYLPLGLVGTGLDAAVLRYNVLFVLAFALASLGTYALVRQLGAGRVAAGAAAVAFAYAPWRYGHVGHLNVLSSGGIPLALAMLARGHGWSLRRGYRPERVRPGWAVAGWAVAAWQVTLGFGLGIPFAYVLAGAGLAIIVAWLVRRPRVPGSLVVADAAGAAGFAVVGALMALPYLGVLAAHPETRRSWEYIALFSPPPRGFAVAPDASLTWGGWHSLARDALENAPHEKALLGGVVLYGLAAVGLVVSVWTVRQRVLLGVGVLGSALLTLGTEGPAYRLLYDVVPGFDSSRTPGRLVLWTTLLLVVLAAGPVQAWAERPVRLPRFVLALPLLLVLVEGLPRIGHPEVPPPPPALAVAPAPLMVLPSDVYVDTLTALWASDRFPEMVNGGSGGVYPPVQSTVRTAMRGFPDANSVALLRGLGVRSVVVLRAEVLGSEYEAALRPPPAMPGVTVRDVGPDLVYELG